MKVRLDMGYALIASDYVPISAFSVWGDRSKSGRRSSDRKYAIEA